MEEDVKPSEDILAVITKSIESLEKLLNLKMSADRTLYVESIEKLQLAVCSEESAMHHFVFGYAGGIQLLVAILEKNQDQCIRHSTILIMQKMLLNKRDGREHAQTFAMQGVIDHLLKLIVKCQLSWGDDFVSSLYKVTAKIADEDKKFAVKARFLGVLPVIVCHIKAFAKKNKVLNPILKLLKKVMASSVNATKLSKDGLAKELLYFLDDHKKAPIVPVLDAISEATRTRHAARQFVKEEVISKVTHLIFNIKSPGSNRMNSAICKTCLKILVHLTQNKIGREKLIANDTIPTLLSWCEKLLNEPGIHYDILVPLVSSVIQRCLPARPLPVRKLNNPIVFNFVEGANQNESDSSEGRNDDSLSLASSNLSSVESGTDSEDESRPFNFTESQFNESIEQYSVFFEELVEPEPIKMKPQYTSDDHMIRENFRIIHSEKLNCFIDLQDLKFHSHIPRIIPKHFSGRKMNEPKQTREKLTKSVSSSSFHTTTSTKIPKKVNCSDSICDISRTPSPSLTGQTVFRLTESMRFSLYESAKEEHRNHKFLETLNLSEVYENEASKTIPVMPFVKIAYPELVISEPEIETPLLWPDPFLVRHKIFRHCQLMSQADYFYLEIYNFDNLLNENVPVSGPLRNNDDVRIYTSNHEDHLKFEARFESGNLRKVYWNGGLEYDLILNPDVNSKTHLQWFYFEVSGMQSNCPYTFNIINMEKSTSQFNDGMCPVMFSVRNHIEKKQGWHRAGSDICYFRNHFTQGPSTNSILRNKPYYTLTFTITFEHNNDVCYIAYHYPYTYSTLQTHLYYWTYSYDSSTMYFRQDELCKTMAGNKVPLLTVTSKPVDTSRPYIFLSARVHPGESNSSWIMKGCVNYLLSSKAQRLRDTYIFKIIPMLNPDGVINGCHRCSLSGQDLNRQWISPSLHVHPSIYSAKALFQYLFKRNRKPLVFCDIHGHSRRFNSFLFGCNPLQSWWPNDETRNDCDSFKILPSLMSEMASTFSLNECEFSIERGRESTGRVTVWRQFDVSLSYTLECSYGGFNQGKYMGLHIRTPQLEETGVKLCQCFGKLVFDQESNRVKSSIVLDIQSFAYHRADNNLRCYTSTSTETEEDCDEENFSGHLSTS